jgi:hypothetical protein
LVFGCLSVLPLACFAELPWASAPWSFFAASLTAPPWLQFLPPTASDCAIVETARPWAFGAASSGAWSSDVVVGASGVVA